MRVQILVCSLWQVRLLEQSLDDREALLRLLNMTHNSGHVDPQSLAEIPPLLIGAAAVGAVGAGLGLMGMMGVFNSHRTRRREKDRTPPCESTDPLDTNDNDCATTRFNKMVKYYPYHKNLEKLQRMVIQGEDETEGLMGHISKAIGRNQDQIFGIGGSSKKPSTTDGIKHETRLLLDASFQLQGATVATTDEMYDRAIQVTDNAIDDVRTLKEHLADSFSDLMMKYSLASKMQQASSKANTDRMNGAAGSELRKSVQEVLAKQREIGGQIAQSQKDAQKLLKQYSTEKTRFAASLKDAADILDATKDKLENQQSSSETSLGSMVSQTGAQVSQTGTKAHKRVADQVALLADDWQTQTKAALAVSQDGWTDMTGTSMRQQKALADAVDEDLLNGLSSNATTAAKTAASNISDAIEDTQSSVESRFRDSHSSVETISNANSAISRESLAGADGLSIESRQVASEMDTEAREVKQKLTDISSSGITAGNSGFKDLLGALADAHGDAASLLHGSEAEYTQLISQVLKKTGSDGQGMSVELSRVAGLIRSGKVKSVAEIESLLGGIMKDVGSKGSGLMDATDEVTSSLNAEEQKLASQLGLTESQLRNLIINGDSSVLQSLGMSAGDRQRILARYTSDQNEQYGNSIAGATDVRSVSQGLVDGLRGMDQGIANSGSMISAFSGSDGDSVKQLSRTLADADESVIQAFESERARAAKLSWSALSAQRSRVSKSLKSGARELDAKLKILNSTSEGFLADGTAMKDRTDSLRSEGEGLGEQVQNRVETTERSVGDINTKFRAKLGDFELEESGKISTLTAEAKNGIDQSTVADVSAFVAEYIGSKEKKTADQTSKSNSDQRVLTDAQQKTANDIADLELKADALNADMLATKRLRQDLGTALREVDSDFAFANTQADQLRQKLESLKSTSESAIRNVTTGIREEVMGVPSLITSGIAALDRDFQLASADLSAAILKTRESLATAKSDEQRDESEQGLIVLTKLQAVQQGVLEADQALRNNISGQHSYSLKQSQGVQNAMAVLLAGIASVTNQLDRTKDLEDVGRMTASIVSDFGVLTNSTADRLSDDAAQAALAEALAFRRNQSRIDREVGRVNIAFDSAGSMAANKSIESDSMLRKIDGLLARLDEGTPLSRKSTSERINAVLSDVTLSATKIVSDSDSLKDDILTRLALVRMAMSSFLSLWNEYAVAADRKIRRMVAGDREFAAGLESSAKHRLVEGERFASRTKDQIQTLMQEIESARASEGEYEERFSEEMKLVRAQTDTVNRGHNKVMLDLSSMIDNAANGERRGGLMEKIRGLLDKFANSIY